MRHRGHRKAVVGVGRHSLEISFHILATGASDREPGPDHFARIHAERTKRRCLRQLAHRGYQGALSTEEAA
jgi:hypothetical protein